MRIWDIPPRHLCAQHLLGEHRELHAIWSILTQRERGYARHPETRRWKGRLRALHALHERIVREFFRRGYAHRSPLDARVATGARTQPAFVNSREEQRRIPRVRRCGCCVAGVRS